MAEYQPQSQEQDRPPPTKEELDALLRRAKDPNRLYPLQSHKYYGFYTGRLDDGRQAIVTYAASMKLAIHIFDADGNLLSVELRDPPFKPRPQEMYLAENESTLLVFLLKELSFRPALVYIKQPASPPAEFSIDPLHDNFEDFLRDPYDNFSDYDRREEPSNIREWIENGEFVFNYCNDYWVDSSGEVTSS